jgi:NADH-quinone oxidoreductase subunit M
MLFLAAACLLCAIWFTPPIENRSGSSMSCSFFLADGAIGAFASLDLFFFYAFHELALIPTFLLIGIWGSGNRFGAAGR